MASLNLDWLSKDKHFDAVAKAYNETVDGYLQGVYKCVRNDFVDSFPPKSYRDLRFLIALGNNKITQFNEYERRLAELSDSLGNVVKARKLLIYVEGHDTAGKTSTSLLLAPLLKKAGYTVGQYTFRAPTKEERKQPLTERYRTSARYSPTNAIIWERGPAGDWVYGSQDQNIINSYNELENWLVEDNGFELVKVHLRSEKHRQARALGKRAGRLKIAQIILSSDKTLNEDQQMFAMQLANSSISERDIHAFTNFETYDTRFKYFVAQTNSRPWLNIDTTRRAESRTYLLAGLMKHFNPPSEE